MVKSISDRFWPKVEKTETCWRWKGASGNRGYGMFAMKLNGRWMPMSPHRVSYLLTKGAIPKGLYVLHLCDNPSCVNPDHLRLGTQQENMNDFWMRGHRGGKGVRRNVCEKNPHAKLTETDVQAIKERIMNGEKQRDVANDYDVNQSTISDIKNNKLWKR